MWDNKNLFFFNLHTQRWKHMFLFPRNNNKMIKMTTYEMGEKTGQRRQEERDISVNIISVPEEF